METAEWNKLVKAAIKQEPGAFELIVQKKMKSILFCTNKFLYNPAFAEDAAQEIIICMYKSIHMLQNPKAFNVWMHRIILGVCSRMNKKYPASSCVNTDEEYVYEKQNDFLMPEHEAENNEKRSEIMAAINELPARQRLTIIMFYFEELSYKEIAHLLDITVSGVASTIANAKKSLQKNLSAQVLQGVAIAPLLSEVLNAEANIITGSSKMLRLGEMTKGASAIEKSLASAGKSGAATIKNFILNSVAVATTAVVLTGGLIYLSPPKNNDYINAEIEMLGSTSHQPEHINPASIELDTSSYNGKTPVWQIKDKDNRIVMEGKGNVLNEELLLMAPGTYFIEWTLEEGSTLFYVSRIFEIR